MNKTLRLCLQGLALTLLVGGMLFQRIPATADGPLAITETPTDTATAVVPTETPTPTQTPTGVPSATPTVTPTPVLSGQTPTPTPTATSPSSSLPAEPVVTLVKRISQDRVVMGSVVQYDLIVTNPNDVAIANVVVQDALPAQVDYVGATSPVGTVSYDAGTRTVTVALGTLAARQEVTIAIQARVNANASTSNPIVNQATITFSSNRTTTSNTVTAQLIPGSLPETGVGPGPREIVTMALILGMAALTILALYDRTRKPEVREQPEIIQD